VFGGDALVELQLFEKNSGLDEVFDLLHGSPSGICKQGEDSLGDWLEVLVVVVELVHGL
jgi:hypothetical protein